ncbi:MAG: glycosyltransferase family 1 protein [Nostocaceae cyanobacterium]|nr:glycosyltransferase family 1 protein [Nostocaceae cyanobacterium]
MSTSTKLKHAVKENRHQNSIAHPPIRILHVVGGMVRGGIETWLMHILRHIDRDRFHMDFLVLTPEPCAYDEEIRALGSRVIPCPLQRWLPWIFAANFPKILEEYGPYDIVHSHVHHFSGYILRLAKQAGVSLCIAHSHNDTSSQEAKAGLYRRLYCQLTEFWITRHATLGLGCSCKAAADLFGAEWGTDPRWQILYYGIDLTPFENVVDSQAVRAELGIPADAFVIGHVGRFHPQKNHQFLIAIAAEIAKREPKMRLLLLGEGYLQPKIRQQVLQMGLGDKVIFAGSRPDVPRLMLGAMDVFLLPSLHEGLPLVLLEAQAAGLPCIFTDVITREVNTVQPLINRLSLSQPAQVWAETVIAQKQKVSNITKNYALALVKQSPFSIETSVQNLENIYQAQLVSGGVV